MIGRSSWYQRKIAPNRFEKTDSIFTSLSGLSRNLNAKEFNLSQREFDQFFKKLLTARQPIFICHRDTTTPEVIHWLNTLGYILGQSESFLSLPSASNFQGMLDMGILPDYLPGYQPLDQPAVIHRISHFWNAQLPSQPGLSTWDSYERINSGHIKGIICWQQDPVGTAELPLSPSDDSFMIVADMFLTETARMAQVVFPLVPFFESEGTITNAESRIQKFEPAVKSITGKTNWQIISELAAQIDHSWNYKKISDIMNEIKVVVPEYQKEIALFRNGYFPNEALLKNSSVRRVNFGANFIEKWNANFYREYMIAKKPREQRIKV